jgi:sugar phosphate isomerase/epimerase
MFSLNGNIGFMTEGAVQRSKKLINLASKLGADIVVNTIGGPGHHEDLATFFARVADVADFAGTSQVTLAIEVHGEHSSNGSMLLEIIRKVGHPNVKINYDTGNCVYFGDSWPYEDLQLAVPELAHIHLKDKIGGKGVWNFPPIGMGEVDFRRVLHILHQGGYRGPLSVEIEFDHSGWPPVAMVHEAARTAYRNLMSLLEE